MLPKGAARMSKGPARCLCRQVRPRSLEEANQASAVNALFIVPALRGDSLGNLFSTHPSIEERVRRLEEMQRQLEMTGHV